MVNLGESDPGVADMIGKEGEKNILKKFKKYIFSWPRLGRVLGPVPGGHSEKPGVEQGQLPRGGEQLLHIRAVSPQET